MQAGKTRYTKNINIAVFSFINFEVSSIKQTILKEKQANLVLFLHVFIKFSFIFPCEIALRTFEHHIYKGEIN